MPLPFSLSCVSDCFKQQGQDIKVDIHNDIPDIESKIMSILETKIIPLLEKVLDNYIKKLDSEQIKLLVNTNETERCSDPT